MSVPEALVDSNVLIASVVEDHAHHEPSIALLTNRPPRTFAVAAHSYAETYSTLTRRNASAPFRWSAEEAWAAVESLASVTALVGLSPGQTFDAVRSYARSGGVGARLYDSLIGQAAVHYEIMRVVTWNVGHMRGLFPGLEVVDPTGWR